VVANERKRSALDMRAAEQPRAAMAVRREIIALPQAAMLPRTTAASYLRVYVGNGGQQTDSRGEVDARFCHVMTGERVVDMGEMAVELE
jgi:hypothetical protein